MKKLIVTSLILLASTSNVMAGGIWDIIKNTTSDGTIETKQYVVEVAGVDIRGYVYEVPEMQSICWQVFTESFHQLECKTFEEIGLNKNSN